MMRKGILFILVGPSGAGKNTLMKRVQRAISDLPQLATATTRPKRPGEQEGREHRFVTKEEFQHLIDTNALIEYQPVHSGHLYGTPRETVESAIFNGTDLIADIEFLGAGKIYQAYPDHTVPIFVTPSSLDLLTDRIKQRGNSTSADLAHRLERVRFEMTFAPQSHYVLINDYVTPATEHLRQIILSERARRRNDVTRGLPLVNRPCIHSNVIALVQHEGCILGQIKNKITTFPAFPVDNDTDAPHDVLQAHIYSELSQAIIVDTILDERFDFTAPHHVETAVIPNDVFLYFYYKCTTPKQIAVPGWDWLPTADLKLSAPLRRLLQNQPDAL